MIGTKSPNSKFQIVAICAAGLLMAGIGLYATNGAMKTSITSIHQQTTLPDLTKLGLPSADAAQVDYYLKIEGVDGEATDDRHKGQIEIQSFSWGVSNPSTVGPGSAGSGAGRESPTLQSTGQTASFYNLNIMKRLDKSTPMLFLKAASGEHIPEVVLTGQLSGENPSAFYTITMSDVIISSFWQPTPEGQPPMESVSFNFAKIEISYTPMSADGTAAETVKAGWDVKSNTKV
jgi:type VI secretion system secreted protein Hcp